MVARNEMQSWWNTIRAKHSISHILEHHHLQCPAYKSVRAIKPEAPHWNFIQYSEPRIPALLQSRANPEEKRLKLHQSQWWWTTLSTVHHAKRERGEGRDQRRRREEEERGGRERERSERTGEETHRWRWRSHCEQRCSRTDSWSTAAHTLPFAPSETQR